MQYKRKRLGYTDYKERLKLVKTRKLRLVFRKSLKNFYAQIIEYNDDGDKVLVTATTFELDKKYNLGIPRTNLPSSYLLGVLIAIKAKNNGIKEAILDIGAYRNVKGSLAYGFLKGALDGGLDIPHEKKVLPSEDRILGKHIVEYAKKGKKFTGYKVDINNLGKHLNEVKDKILRVK
ncbi:50S ribosomal protein L18 [Candidatus Woesearchaeota archaeon]|nr:50S ribosomal protein L18 [Candidatus Woesearchaeota archaeon]